MAARFPRAPPVNRHHISGIGIGFLWLLGAFPAFSQIDPVGRELVQVGYNAALQGKPPISAYAFYYHNQPEFLRSNLTLRLALAPTYLDSELGFRSALGAHTDLGLGLAGGGFADSYAEIRGGKYLEDESFVGHGAELDLSIYHRFNPGGMIPLNGVLRAFGRYSAFNADSDTADDFVVPDDMGRFGLRAGLRWGGREPVLFPSLAMEISAWYEGEYRTQDEVYGYGDREIEEFTHSYWLQALLAYTIPKWEHQFYVSLTLGGSVTPDRLSAYRLGALLPLVSEFPLSLPGYYYQEISAERFVLFGANYLVPITRDKRWNLNVQATTAVVDYLPGLEQPGDWHTGVGGGIVYRSPSWKVMLGYAYGVDAIRSGERGAHSIGVLLQLDLEKAKEAWIKPEPAGRWRGVQRILGVLGN